MKITDLSCCQEYKSCIVSKMQAYHSIQDTSLWMPPFPFFGADRSQRAGSSARRWGRGCWGGWVAVWGLVGWVVVVRGGVCAAAGVGRWGALMRYSCVHTVISGGWWCLSDMGEVAPKPVYGKEIKVMWWLHRHELRGVQHVVVSDIQWIITEI